MGKLSAGYTSVFSWNHRATMTIKPNEVLSRVKLYTRSNILLEFLVCQPLSGLVSRRKHCRDFSKKNSHSFFVCLFQSLLWFLRRLTIYAVIILPYFPQTVSKSQRTSVCHLSRLCVYGISVNLKVKSLLKWEANKCLFEINKNSYSGDTDSGRSPNGLLVWRQRQRVFKRKGRRNNCISRREASLLVQIT